jgi:hypothetical protein
LYGGKVNKEGESGPFDHAVGVTQDRREGEWGEGSFQRLVSRDRTQNTERRIRSIAELPHNKIGYRLLTGIKGMQRINQDQRISSNADLGLRIKNKRYTWNSELEQSEPPSL